ncbi:MAG: DUF2695 domain-containing protein [Deltaproteobacteria bacterium]|nr:DUF2695 domain-containing protein [Deltaproteobacteria bacterium]
MNYEPPISHESLRGLFEYLDRTSMTGYQCDHEFTLTNRFLIEHYLSVEPMLEWLGDNGAWRDCEVMFNVAPQWEEIVGHIPPDLDP